MAGSSPSSPSSSGGTSGTTAAHHGVSFTTKVLMTCIAAVAGTTILASLNIEGQIISNLVPSTISLRSSSSSSSSSHRDFGRAMITDGSSSATASLYDWDESQCRKEDASQSEQQKYNILVTGGAGFVGMHTCIDLKAKGHNVVAFDILNDYYSPALKERRLELLAEHDIEFIKGDVCDSPTVAQLLKDKKIDRIIHLAAQAGVRYSLDHPMEYTKNNIDCTVKLLEVVKDIEYPGLTLSDKKKIPVVYASSSSVYGKNTKIPFSETDEVIQQASLYGATKKSDELIAHVYHSLYGIPSVGLRFFTVYGTHGRPDMAYFKFADQILKGIPIDMYNHGEMKRDFTYIDDIVNGIVRCLDLPFDGFANKADVVNLGNNRPEVLRHLIEVVEEAVGKKAIINSKPMQPGDVVATYADVRKAQCLLGYEPTTPLEVGIPKFVEWFINENGAEYAESNQKSSSSIRSTKEKVEITVDEKQRRRLLEFF